MNVVGQALFLADALPEPRTAAAAEQVVGHRQRRVVGVVVGQRNALLHCHDRVLLVRRDQTQARGLSRVQRVRNARERLARRPVAQGALQRLANRCHIHVADGGELAFLRAIEAGMEGTDRIEADGVHVLHHVVEAAGMPNVAAWVRIGQPLERHRSHRAGLLALLLDAGQGLPLDLVQCRSRQARIPQQFPDQCDRIGKVRLARHQAHRDLAGAAADAQLGLQFVEPVLHLLTAERAGSLVEQRRQNVGHIALAEQVGRVAEVKHQPRLHHAAARGLRQHGGLDAAHVEALRSAVDRRRARVEGFHAGLRRLRLEGLQLGWNVHLLGRRSAGCVLRRQVGCQRAVVGQQTLHGDALDVGQRHRTHPVAKQEEQAPIALRDGLAERDPDGLRVGEALLPALQPFGARALQFVFGDGLGRHRLQRGQQGSACLGQSLR